MQRRTLDKLGLELPLLGFGCMRLPVNEDKTIDHRAAMAMVDYAINHGINYFDTALMYHNETSESFIGEALSHYPRESFMLTTKLHASYTKTKADVERIFNEQLERCRVDYFDFYLMHDVERTKFDLFRQFEVYEFLKQQQAAGRIKYLGFSSHDDHEQIAQFLDMYQFDVAQLQINYVDWRLRNAEQCYRVLEERGIPCIVMEPIKGGTLADVPDAVREILKASSPQATPASLALRWVASLPNVKMILSGMSSMEQLVENEQVLSEFKPLTDAEQQAIQAAVGVFEAGKQIPCTGCRYCSNCPVGVNIPDIFSLYNRHAIFGAREHFRIRQNYGSFFSDNQKASACVDCGRCVQLCPQHIAIPEELRKVHPVLMEIVNK